MLGEGAGGKLAQPLAWVFCKERCWNPSMRMTKPLHCAIHPQGHTDAEQPLRDGTLDLLMVHTCSSSQGKQMEQRHFCFVIQQRSLCSQWDLWPCHCLHGGWPLHGPNRSTQILPSVPHQLERCLFSLSRGLFTIIIRGSNCLQTHTSLGVYYVTAHWFKKI